MKKLFHLQIFVFAIIVALMGSFNAYAQNKGLKDIQLNLQGYSKVVTNYQPDNITAVPLPVVEDFESGVFPPTGWSRTGTPVIWFNDNTVSGYGVGTWSAVADFYSVAPPASNDLVTIEYISTGATAPQLTFDWAYATYSAAEIDELDIYYSTDAGATWTILLAMPGGPTGILNPFGLVQTAPYFPLDNQWSTMSLALPANTNMVKFTAVTDYGNLCWLDNIKISAQTFFDNFDSYTAGGQLACQNPTAWTTWSNAPCTSEDAFISTNYAYSGVKSTVIAQNNDLVKDLGTKTSGKWYMSFAVYIPAGKTGYFNTLTDWPYSAVTTDWGMDCYFNAGGAGVMSNGSTVNFTWQENHWNQCLVVV
ncbi:MAG: hypothetical protein Q8M94_21450, partial [Ignavibacteria bacterium]|nr:hypothetical protein [Ignavibacteria bacterium]